MSVLLALFRQIPAPHLRALCLFTLLGNVAVLAPSLHMLQIYDRVLSSGSVETLVGVTLAALLVLGVYGLCEMIRSRIASRFAAHYTAERSTMLFAELARTSSPADNTGSLMRDFATLRQFIGSKLFTALFDLPFVVFYLGLLALVHWSVGLLGAIGLGLIVLLAWLNSVLTEKAREEAQKAEASLSGFAQSTFHRAEDVRAMGLVHTLLDTWAGKSASMLQAAEASNRVTAQFAAASRTLRLSIQILIMAWGGWLVLNGSMSGGMIFLASMISGRALAPVDAIIGGWDQMIRAGHSYEKVEKLTSRRSAPRELPDLPDPMGTLALSRVRVDHDDPNQRPILQDVSLELPPGRMLVLIGASGSGKSLLARIIAGAAAPSSGAITMDGIPTARYPRRQWGEISGYLSQFPDLFYGSIASNIGRFRDDRPMTEIYEAAQRVGAHEPILCLAQGYQSVLGDGRLRPAAGLVQRIALARALIGGPRLVVLDEPLNNLDSSLESQLLDTIAAMRESGTSFVIVSQRQSMLRLADQVLLVRDGGVERVRLQTGKEADRRRVPAPPTDPSHAGGALRGAAS